MKVGGFGKAEILHLVGIPQPHPYLVLEMLSLMAKEMKKEEHLKQQQGKESMKHEAEVVLEGLVDWRSGKAAETSEETEAKEMAKERAARERQGN